MNETTGSSFWAQVSEVLSFVPTTPASATLTVNHDNVLAAAKIIQTQIDHLTDIYREHGHSLLIEPAANDPVSTDAARAWNFRLVDADDSYSARIQDYILSLRKLIAQLKDSAKTYGFNDQDIAAAFGTTIA
jgi:hypothetical protein